MVVLGGDGARNAQRGNNGVEECRLDFDGEVGVHSLRRGVACTGADGDDLADGMGMDNVAGYDEVIGMPLSRRQ